MTAIDAAVLERARSGDREAHAALYRAFAPMIFTLARRMLGSVSLAEDVVQDCFVEIIRKAEQFRGEAAIGAWIRRIAINRCLSQLRSPWVQRRSFSAAAMDLQPSAETSIEHRIDTHKALERALDALAPKTRAVVWLYAVEGYTHEEIGRLLGRSTSFSKSQLARACRQLRNQLESGTFDNETEPCLGLLKTV
jgi:RNA polymerase sigma-70 factor (ECF subfamily)